MLGANYAPFDSTIASAVLDRLLHHAETVVIEGTSFRMKDQIQS
jgi:DNA replication protein DnaC